MEIRLYTSLNENKFPVEENVISFKGKCRLFAWMVLHRLMVYIRKGHTLLACSMVYNRSWHLPWNPQLVWHPARLIKEGGCVDLFMDTMHLKDSLALFGFEGSALTLPLFLLSLRIIMFCHRSSTMTKVHFFGNILWHCMAFVCRCAFKPSFIHSLMV